MICDNENIEDFYTVKEFDTIDQLNTSISFLFNIFDKEKIYSILINKINITEFIFFYIKIKFEELKHSKIYQNNAIIAVLVIIILILITWRR